MIPARFFRLFAMLTPEQHKPFLAYLGGATKPGDWPQVVMAEAWPLHLSLLLDKVAALAQQPLTAAQLFGYLTNWLEKNTPREQRPDYPQKVLKAWEDAEADFRARLQACYERQQAPRPKAVSLAKWQTQLAAEARSLFDPAAACPPAAVTPRAGTWINRELGDLVQHLEYFLVLERLKTDRLSHQLLLIDLFDQAKDNSLLAETQVKLEKEVAKTTVDSPHRAHQVALAQRWISQQDANQPEKNEKEYDKVTMAVTEALLIDGLWHANDLATWKARNLPVADFPLQRAVDELAATHNHPVIRALWLSRQMFQQEMSGIEEIKEKTELLKKYENYKKVYKQNLFYLHNATVRYRNVHLSDPEANELIWQQILELLPYGWGQANGRLTASGLLNLIKASTYISFNAYHFEKNEHVNEWLFTLEKQEKAALQFLAWCYSPHSPVSALLPTEFPFALLVRLVYAWDRIGKGTVAAGKQEYRLIKRLYKNYKFINDIMINNTVIMFYIKACLPELLNIENVNSIINILRKMLNEIVKTNIISKLIINESNLIHKIFDFTANGKGEMLTIPPFFSDQPWWEDLYYQIKIIKGAQPPG